MAQVSLWKDFLAKRKPKLPCRQFAAAEKNELKQGLDVAKEQSGSFSIKNDPFSRKGQRPKLYTRQVIPEGCKCVYILDS